jgi:hypothetical protein
LGLKETQLFSMNGALIEEKEEKEFYMEDILVENFINIQEKKDQSI